MPLHSVPAGTIGDGIVWVLLSDYRVFTVMRKDVIVEVSPWLFFTSDCIGIHTIMPLDFAFPHLRGIAKPNVTQR
ncbi:MAG: hypothetical protein ACLQIK_12310 [Mycobacterium sp.]|uniref:hypothetical protein n=1 Tax=Mycobacterium sp. TaxID=1785 RepID=UPI003F9B5E9A